MEQGTIQWNYRVSFGQPLHKDFFRDFKWRLISCPQEGHREWAEGLTLGSWVGCWGTLAGSPDEGGLPGGVLAHQQHHGLVVEIGILQGRRVKLVEAIVLFQRQQLGPVEFLEPIAHGLEDLGVLPPAVVGAQPAEHRGHRSPARPRCAVPAGGRGVGDPGSLGKVSRREGPPGSQPRRRLTGAPGSAAPWPGLRARGSPGRRRGTANALFPCSQDQAQPRLHPATKAGERKNIWVGRESCDLGKKVKPAIKMSDARSPGLPQLSPTLARVQLRDASNLLPPAPEAQRRRRRCPARGQLSICSRSPQPQARV